MSRSKTAYPNYDEFQPFQPPRDVSKWLKSAQNMFHKINAGLSNSLAFDEVTSGWDNMEKKDFSNWLKFYQENNHKKYASAEETLSKVGQAGYWQDSERAGYFVPINHVGDSINKAKDPETNEVSKNESKREIIESQRNKIVSRLDSAEKLLRSYEGQLFAGKEFEALMHVLFELKKKIHSVNKITVAWNRTYNDMIIREANILTKNGFTKASDLLYKISQDMPLPTEPESPLSMQGNPGDLPLPSTPGPLPGQPPSDLLPAIEEGGMKGFLNNLAPIEDKDKSDDLEVHENNEELIVEAQDATVQPKPELEVSEQPVAVEVSNSTSESVVDQKLDHAFSGIKLEDIVQKLEDVTNIYKTRELPRQLSLIDMMLDQVGMASFFPSMAEAINRALDSNQYVLTRLEDITARLRGTMQVNTVDLSGSNPVPSSPELDASRKKLEEEKNKEVARKQLRKDQENAKLEQATKPTPELEVDEDLATPLTPSTTPAAVPTK